MPLALALSVAGCHKEDKKADDKAGSGSAGAAAAPASDEIRSMLAIIPIASDGVVGVDLGKLRGSPLFQSYQKDIEDVAGAELKMVRDLCQIDPMTAASRIIAGGSGTRATGDLTVVIKGLAKQQTMDCLTKVQQKPPEGVTVTIQGDYVKVERVEKVTHVVGGDAGVPLIGSGSGSVTTAAGSGSGSGSVIATPPTSQAIALQFVDDQTVVLAGRSGSAADQAAMQQILHIPQNNSVAGSQGFMAMIDGIDTTAPVWFVVNGKSDTVKKVGRGMLTFDAAFGNVYVTDGLQLDVTVRLDSPDAATRTADLVNREIQQFKTSLMKDKIGEATVEHTDRDVRFHLTESKEQLEKLVEFLGSLLPSLMGD